MKIIKKEKNRFTKFANLENGETFKFYTSPDFYEVMYKVSGHETLNAVSIDSAKLVRYHPETEVEKVNAVIMVR